MNRDGRLDIVTFAVPQNSTTQQLQWYQNIDGTSFSSRTVIAANIATFALIEINNDGASDMVTSNGTNLVYMLNRGNGSFIARDSSLAARSVSYLAAGDLNNDGWSDIIGFNSAGSAWWHARTSIAPAKVVAQVVTPSPTPSSMPSPVPVTVCLGTASRSNTVFTPAFGRMWRLG
jgi:hypothetical protein